MGTLNPIKGYFKSIVTKVLKPLMNERGGDEEMFTQVQVDEQISTAVADAVTKAKSEGFGFDGFAPEVKAHPSITRYKTPEELAKGHIELEKKIGLQGVKVPVEGSSDEVKNDFWKAIGRPEKSEGYADPIRDNLHEALKTPTEQDAKWFKDIAFKEGLSSKQYDNIYKAFLELQSQRLTDYDETQKDERDATTTALRQKWGASADERFALADGLVKKFGSSELFNSLHDNPDPHMVEFLYNIGSQLSEDKLGELGKSSMGMNPEQAKMEITKITQQIMDTPQGDPMYSELIKKKDMLYKMAYPAK